MVLAILDGFESRLTQNRRRTGSSDLLITNQPPSEQTSTNRHFFADKLPSCHQVRAEGSAGWSQPAIGTCY